MKWLAIGTFALVLFFFSVLASTAHTILILRSGGDLLSGYALASVYVVFAISHLVMGFLFARRTGGRPYLSAVVAYVISAFVGALAIIYFSDSSLQFWTWVAAAARDVVFLLLGTAVGLGKLKVQWGRSDADH